MKLRAMWKILDKKAQKLKGIVFDVFSIAKATSGVDVNLTKLDFVMLLTAHRRRRGQDS